VELIFQPQRVVVQAAAELAVPAYRLTALMVPLILVVVVVVADITPPRLRVLAARAAPVLLSSNTLLQLLQPYSHLNLRRNG
jgi:hypothetical protein